MDSSSSRRRHGDGGVSSGGPATRSRSHSILDSLRFGEAIDEEWQPCGAPVVDGRSVNYRYSPAATGEGTGSGELPHTEEVVPGHSRQQQQPMTGEDIDAAAAAKRRRRHSQWAPIGEGECSPSAAEEDASHTSTHGGAAISPPPVVPVSAEQELEGRERRLASSSVAGASMFSSMRRLSYGAEHHGMALAKKSRRSTTIDPNAHITGEVDFPEHRRYKLCTTEEQHRQDVAEAVDVENLVNDYLQRRNKYRPFDVLGELDRDTALKARVLEERDRLLQERREREGEG